MIESLLGFFYRPKKFKKNGDVKDVLVVALVMTFLTACTDYQAEFEESFGALEYIGEEYVSSDANHHGGVSGSGDGVTSSAISGTSVSGKSSSSGAGTSASGKPSSSGEGVSATDKLSSSVEGTSATDKLSSSGAQSSATDNLSSFSVEESSSAMSSSAVRVENVTNQNGGIVPFKVVDMGSQTWQAVNFSSDYSDYIDRWHSQNPESSEKYGYLYKQKDADKECDYYSGWRLPDSADWQTLINWVSPDAGRKLKSKEWSGTDDYGFNVLSVLADASGEALADSSETCYWTTATHSDGKGVAACFSTFNNDVVFKDRDTTYYFPLRCIKGERSSSSTTSSSSKVSSSSVIVSSSSMMKVTDDAGNEYRVVQLGSQIWMADNLKNAVEGSSCYDNQVDTYCEFAGRLYTWEAAREACPEGYRLPYQSDFVDLYDYLDETYSDKVERVVASTEGWPPGFGTNESGLDFYPAGYCLNSECDFWAKGAYFWTETENENNSNEAYFLKVDQNNFYTAGSAIKTYMMSVRCIKK